MRIEVGKLFYCPGHSSHQEWQQGEALDLARILLVQVFAQTLQFGNINLFDVAEMGNAAACVLHALGNLATQTDELNLLEFRSCCGNNRFLCRVFQKGQQVSLGDAAILSRGWNFRQGGSGF